MINNMILRHLKNIFTNYSKGHINSIVSHQSPELCNFSTSKNERTPCFGILCIQSFLLLRKPNNEHRCTEVESQCARRLCHSVILTVSMFGCSKFKFSRIISQIYSMVVSVHQNFVKIRQEKTLSLPLACVLIPLFLFKSSPL